MTNIEIKPNKMTKEEEISQFLEEIALNAKGPVFCSDFGKELVKKYPNFKEEYGGLKSFLTQYCSEKIKLVGKKGGNDLYCHVSIDVQVEDALVGNQPVQPSPRYVFATPNVPWKLYINCATCDLEVAHLRESPTPDHREIAFLTTFDHKKIAAQFITLVKENEQEPLQQILNLEEFWPAWQDELQNNQKQNLFKWNSFRRKSIDELFKSKLEEFELSDESNARLMSKFQEPSKTKPKKPLAPDPRYSTRNSNHNKPEFESLRSLTLKIVGKMNQEELLGLKVLMSSVYNALNSASDS